MTTLADKCPKCMTGTLQFTKDLRLLTLPPKIKAACDFCDHVEYQSIRAVKREVDTSSTDKAMRFNTNKPKISMVMEAKHALEGITKVLEFGAEKYDRSNWKKGLPLTEILDSMARHQLALLSGELIDPESNLPHVHHIGCNALFLAEIYETLPEFNDFPKSQEG